MSYKLLAWDQVLILDHMTFLSIMSHFCKTQFSAAAAGIKSKCQVKINMEEEMRKEIDNQCDFNVRKGYARPKRNTSRP